MTGVAIPVSLKQPLQCCGILLVQGIVFSVRPPKKSWKHIANLSGGEKTLSSLSLVFALHHYKPTPLYVMDEIDAALDFKNVSIGGCALTLRSYIKAAALLLGSHMSWLVDLAIAATSSFHALMWWYLGFRTRILSI